MDRRRRNVIIGIALLLVPAVTFASRYRAWSDCEGRWNENLEEWSGVIETAERLDEREISGAISATVMLERELGVNGRPAIARAAEALRTALSSEEVDAIGDDLLQRRVRRARGHAQEVVRACSE